MEGVESDRLLALLRRRVRVSGLIDTGADTDRHRHRLAYPISISRSERDGNVLVTAAPYGILPIHGRLNFLCSACRFSRIQSTPSPTQPVGFAVMVIQDQQFLYRIGPSEVRELLGRGGSIGIGQIAEMEPESGLAQSFCAE